MKSLITLVTAATLAAGAFSTAARADASNEFQTETVRFADLDTSNVPGAAALYKRTRHAAERVCRNLDPGRALSLMEPYNACVQLALTNAVATINRPAVTAYATARGVDLAEATIKIARAN